MSHRHVQTAALALFAALASNVAAAQADTNATGVQPQPGNPYSPAYGHPYRGGVVPTRTVQARMRAWDNTHLQATQVTSANTLAYLGGPVMSGATKVYLVFYGNQWGTTYVDANGNLAFAHDPSRVAGAAQQMFKGIGTHNETWQADLTQWCDGSGVPKNATACPASPASGVNWIPYQHNVLAGVWYDSSAASPSAATTAQLGKEAVAAAAHFGNTTPESNRYTYYVILSAQGTNPDNFLTGGGYCAWHGDTKSIRVISTAGDLAFSNQPYNTDLGVGCGVGFVNTPGTTDGYTMTLGHEWHEMMSDPVPATGWFNVHNNAGGENSDECVWLDPGTPGGAANITFNTGIFAEQSSWSNDTNRCDISHAIASHQLMGNKGFESAGSWTASTGVLCTNATCSTETARTGNGFALLGGLGTANTQTLSQAVTIPAGFTTATLKYYLHTDTAETSTTAGHDKLTVALYDGPTLLKTLHSSSNLNANAGYSVRSSDLSAWIGQTLTLTFTSKENGSLQTSFAVDDVTLLVK